MPQYVLLLQEAPDLTKDWSPEEMQAVIQKYVAWRQKLQRTGRLVGGHKLTDGVGRALRGKGAEQTVTDRPFAESREVIGGLFVVEGASYEDVVELSRDCPHLEFGTIEIREIERTVTPDTK
jgi:hypothetical protein